ncbi:folylpolyglutamate synthase [Coemansia asiatica]|nr:folylpolyglutamate synthase [Coemansia asiatica]
MTVSDNSGRIKLGLERIINFFENVFPTDPRAKLQIVHVAGTNGKGSVCALISEALISAGYKAGTFNSPHFLRTNDAVRIQGVPIPAAEYAELRSWISTLDTEAQAPMGPLSLFEQSTVAAIWWFAKNDVDLAVIEVGMGGLRDATNVFGTPDGRSSLGVGKSLVQCICPVDADHLGVIGNSIEEIAHEKAGIMRPGSWIVVASQDRIEAFHKIRQIAQRISPGRIVNVRRQPTYDLHVPTFAIRHSADDDADLVARMDQPGPVLPSWASFNGTGRRCLRVKYPPSLEAHKNSVSSEHELHAQNQKQAQKQGESHTEGSIQQHQQQDDDASRHEHRSSRSRSASATNSQPMTVELDLPLVLPGYYQASNASVAFYALDVLRTHYDFTKLTDAAIQVGFQNVRWPGRLSWLPFSRQVVANGTGASTPVSHNSAASSSSGSSNSDSQHSANDSSGKSSIDETNSLDNWILADGAHNEPAAVELRRYVDTTLRRVNQQRYIHATHGRSFKDVPHIRWIIGFTQGKDMKAILSKLVFAGDSVWAVPFSQPDEMPWISCTDPKDIETAVRGLDCSEHVQMTTFGSLGDALDRLAGEKSDSHLTVACGSLYLVSNLYRELHIDPFQEAGSF